MQYSFYPLEGDIQLDIQSLQRLAHIPITNINDILSVHKWAGLVQSHAPLLDMPITGLWYTNILDNFDLSSDNLTAQMLFFK